MKDSPSNQEIVHQNQGAVRELLRLITNSQGEFSLILALCNCGVLTERVVPQIESESSLPIKKIVLDPQSSNLYTSLTKQLGENQPQVLMVLGLEALEHLEQVLTATNQIREEFRNLHFPMILWVTDEVVSKLIRLVPDFYSWSTHVEFMVSNGDLIDCIQKTCEEVFHKLAVSRENIFLDSADLDMKIDSPRYIELKKSYQELQNRQVPIDKSLEANLEFVLGRVADNSNLESRRHYERSLELWQQTNNLEKQGYLLFYLGLWWRNYAVHYQAEKERACEQAKIYFEQCVHIFDEAHQPQSAAKFINFLAEVLHRLEDWQELEQVVNQALALHRAYGNQFRQARAYGFLAELALAKSDGYQAQTKARKALFLLAKATAALLNSSPEEYDCLKLENSFHQGWYLFSLAKAQQQLGQVSESIKTLEQARKITKPQYDPELYIGILATLREGYFQQNQYLHAFQIKQRQQTIESQFGVRAFIGAMRLQPDQQVTNPALPKTNSSGIIAHEITASSREGDVNRLLERIYRDDLALTIIHGQSGVGKSSLLEAGLIPALESTTIATRQVIPVLQRVYSDWIKVLGKSLEEKLVQRLDLTFISMKLETEAAILEQLNHNGKHNRLTVLIFDQFEEFFLVCKDIQQRRIFYEFLSSCLSIPFVKVILSIREDYLPFLLECNNRLVDLDVVNNNILDKNILYYLGNLPPEDARSLIKNLTETTHFPLESTLIDALVADLTQGVGEVLPIELQVVGAQLENDGITTLEKYRQLGDNPKGELVHRYLAEVLRDCGEENQRAAELVLYLLTDDNNTRPLKSRQQLIKELKTLAFYLETESEKIDLALAIFVASGLVFWIKEIPGDRYQLVHDYLVSFIRQRQGFEIITELEEERERRQQAEVKLKKVLEKQLQAKKRQISQLGFTLFMALMTTIAVWQLQVNDLEQKQTNLARLNLQYQLSLSKRNQLDALLSILKASQDFNHQAPKSELEQQTVNNLWRAAYFTQERNRLEDHRASVLSLSVSPDGELIASGSKDKTIKLWNRQGELQATLAGGESNLQGHQDTVWCVDFSPDSQLIVSASKDQTIKLWNRKGELLNTFTGHLDEVKWVSFSPDGELIASASKDGTVKLWNRKGELLKTLTDHEGAVFSVAWSPDGQSLASGSKDKTIKIWSRDGTLLYTSLGHEKNVLSVTFSPDGKLLASASDDRTIKVWNREGKLLKTLEGHEDAVNTIAFNPNLDQSARLVSADSDGHIKLWTWDGKLITTISGHASTVNQVIFTTDGKTVASASLDTSIRLWNLDNILPEIWQPQEEIYGSKVSFSPDSQLIAAASRKDDTVKILNFRARKLLKNLRGHSGWVNSTNFSPDGQLLVTGSNDKTVRIWRPQRGKMIRVLRGHKGTVNHVTFSPDGQLIASASDDQTIKLWQRDGKLFKTLEGHTEAVNHVSFSSDGELLASASADNMVKIWDKEGNLIASLVGEGQFSSVSFSPVDNRVIVAGTAGGKIQWWYAQDSSWQLEPTTETVIGHGNSVYQVSFSPNGAVIASGSEDGTIKIWNREGLLLANLLEGTNRVESVNFLPNGKLVSLDSTSTISVWDGSPYQSYANLDPQQLFDLACTQIKDYWQSQQQIDSQGRKLCQSR